MNTDDFISSSSVPFDGVYSALTKLFDLTKDSGQPTSASSTTSISATETVCRPWSKDVCSLQLKDVSK
jgi:hypothetical protein